MEKRKKAMEASAIEKLEEIYSSFLHSGGNIISALQDIQTHYRYVPEETVYWFAERSGIPPSKFYGVITFYGQFHTKPRGENIITACCGTVCHVKGAHRIMFRLKDELSLKGEQDTTRDEKFTLENVACVGACSIAPVVLVNDKVCGNMNPDKVIREIKKIKTAKEKGKNSE